MAKLPEVGSEWKREGSFDGEDLEELLGLIPNVGAAPKINNKEQKEERNQYCDGSNNCFYNMCEEFAHAKT